MKLPYDPAIPLLEMREKLKQMLAPKTCAQMFFETIVKNGNNLQWLINRLNMFYIHTMKYFLVVTNNKILIHVKTDEH